jgi:membrane associated rhomboid family serine protease
MSHLHLPHPGRLGESTRPIREAFWVLAICVVAMFAFFMVIGSVNPANAAGATVVVGGLAAAYLWHSWRTSRKADSRDPRIVRARERRGF